jgi:hypothetical protein
MLMKVAAVTFVYNEIFNLSIWIKYYGNLFGRNNLFIVDRGSDDGSTTNLGDVNLLHVPRKAFDEYEKTNFMSSFHASLTSFYDAVIITDCDEIIVPDPAIYADLNQYIEALPRDYVSGVGINLLHLITEELPIDPSRGIMSQRKYGFFFSPQCKLNLSRVPIKWLPGMHSCNKRPVFDLDLFTFHIKTIDYGVAVSRQQINQKTIWSDAALAQKHGAHHRYNLKQFVHESFLSPLDLHNRSLMLDFEFSKEILTLESRITVDNEGNFHIPMDIQKYVIIPERFSEVF